MVGQIKKFFVYLFNKRSEINDLDFRDALLAQANVRIYRTRSHKTFDMIPLNRLQFIHKLQRENALQVLGQRIKIIKEHKDKICIDQKIKMDAINEFLPSVSMIKVIEDNFGNYLAFEGNGRIAALKDVYNDDQSIYVEVEQYHFKNKRKVLKMLNRIRRLNGLL